MTQTEPLYHITDRRHWEAARFSGEYRAESLTTDGFIHCSLRRQLIAVANVLYRCRCDLIIPKIDPVAVAAEIRHEGGADRFPHIYGPLNGDAVVDVIDFPPQSDGLFALPPDLT